MRPITAPAPARHLILIDWGTSSLRAALVDGRGAILDRLDAPQGIMATQGRPYGQIFAEVFGPWLALYPEATALASGMIGSRQGWVEAPYASCPAAFTDLAGAIVWHQVETGTALGFVPGISHVDQAGVPDVIRGEEIQVFGALSAFSLVDGLFVLPGTHSKWIEVEGGRIVRFRTFMTGEVYALLRRHSILGRLMPEAEDGAADPAAFADGCVAAGGEGALLHALFGVRTLGLFGHMTVAQLPDYLSGLLIGEEVRAALAALGARPRQVHLICRSDLAERYRLCLAARDIDVSICGDDVTYGGLFALAKAGNLVEGEGRR
ncbi:MAG: 2-dehydro-3-deoxygalactonokinase [Rhizobiales bacterium]|nr:2-dehydro-3-deoxygalactonokinase [Hyphomicrobiales bacterium]